jgi:chromosome partitioning protein
VQCIVIASRKGGCGKSQLARNLAVSALMEGVPTGIIDADDQATLVHWRERRPHDSPTVLALGSNSIGSALADLRGRGAGLAIIDLPPHSLPLVNSAIAEADYCIIVTEPLVEALEQVGTTVRIVQALKKPAGIVINKAPSRAAALNLARSALAAFEIPICPQQLTSLIVHSYSAAGGLVPAESEPKGKAATEIAAVWSWIKGQMNDVTSAGKVSNIGGRQEGRGARAGARATA